MADESVPGIPGTSKRRNGPWKIVALLAFVLVAVNFLGSGGDNEQGSAELSSAATSSRNLNDTNNSTTIRRAIPWPVIPLEFLLANNPFQPEFRRGVGIAATDALPAESDPKSADSPETPQPGESETSIATETPATPTHSNALTGKKLQLVFRGPRGTAAMIDDKMYREGDKIDNYLIADIECDGVTLRETGTPAPAPVATGTEIVP